MRNFNLRHYADRYRLFFATSAAAFSWILEGEG